MDQDELKRRWGEVTRPARLMLAAVGVSFVSQFLPSGDRERGFLIAPTNTDVYTGMGHVSERATGWQLHPLAWLTLLALAVLFASPLVRSGKVRPWMWWLAVAALVFGATVPTAPVRAFGGLVALAAVAIAAYAAWLRGRVK